MSMVPHERRAHRRYVFHLPAQLRCLSHPDLYPETHAATIRDIGARGLFAECTGHLPESAEVELTFTLPASTARSEDAVVRCSGPVLRWSLGPGRLGFACRIEHYSFLPTATGAEQ